MNPIWLMRMKRLIQNPPSPRRIKFMFAIFAICMILVGIEQFIGWPEALTPNRLR